MVSLAHCYNIADLRDAARRRLPKGVFDYLDRGAEDDVALRDNCAAFERLKLGTRFLVDLGERDMGVDLLGVRAELPLVIAPTGFAGMCWYRGELALAKAAASAGVPFTLCAHATMPMETIAREAGGRLWIQVHMWRDERLSYAMIETAKALGFEALVLTIDTALGRNREYNLRNGFGTPFRPNLRATIDMTLHPTWLFWVMARYVATTGVPRYVNYPEPYRRTVTRGVSEKDTRKETMTWDDVRRLRDVWPNRLVVKGILSGADAAAAVASGADAVVVSNHGGRALDSAAPTIDVLPEVAKEVAGQATVLVDGGIRRGSDIVKSLARGADAVMVGRAPLYGVSAAGQRGAEHALRLLAAEFEQTMGYVGCRRVSELSRQIFFPPEGGVTATAS